MSSPHTGVLEAAVRDARLDDAVRRASSPDGRTDRGSVLVTGATGLVGRALLRVLENGPRVRCLVRGADARARLGAANVDVVVGDLAQPLFGLSEREFDDLADDVEVVFHLGAHVTFDATHEQLRGPNVQGTQEVLRLAARGRRKTVHHASTIGVFTDATTALCMETDVPAPPRVEDRISGYASTKWAAERLVAEAGRREVPVVIHRIGNVVDSRFDDEVAMMLGLFGAVGSAPAEDAAFAWRGLAPVRFVARAMAAAATRPEIVGSTIHLCSPDVVDLKDILGAFATRGRALESLTVREWLGRVRKTMGSDPSLLALLQPLLLTRQAAARGGVAQRREYSADVAARVLEGTDAMPPRKAAILAEIVVPGIPG